MGAGFLVVAKMILAVSKSAAIWSPLQGRKGGVFFLVGELEPINHVDAPIRPLGEVFFSRQLWRASPDGFRLSWFVIASPPIPQIVHGETGLIFLRQSDSIIITVCQMHVEATGPEWIRPKESSMCMTLRVRDRGRRDSGKRKRVIWSEFLEWVWGPTKNQPQPQPPTESPTTLRCRAFSHPVIAQLRKRPKGGNWCHEIGWNSLFWMCRHHWCLRGAQVVLRHRRTTEFCRFKLRISQRLASVNVVAVDRHRRIAVWVCFLRTLQCFVHMCTLMASFRLEMKMLPVVAAYTKLLLLLRCQPHAIYSMVTLPFFAYNLIRLQGLFIFGLQKWLNSPTGGSKRPMPHATRPPASRAEEAISDRQHLLAAAFEITPRSPKEAKEGNCFNRCPKYIRVS